jgi:hypothetical protein
MLSCSGGASLFVPTPRQNMAGPIHMGGGTAFHYSMLLFFPNGGVCRGVFEPRNYNFWLVGELGSRWVVLTRHPADRIVAQYCMRSEELSAAASNSDGLSAFQLVFRGAGLPYTVDSLRDNLQWLAGWAAKASDAQILVVRYEDMVRDAETHFAAIHEFLFQKGMAPELVAGIRKHIGNSGEAGPLQSGDGSTRVYEKGYSGQIGVWRNYLSAADIADYNATVERFLAYDDNAASLIALYPDLLLN